jgi:hypothetical protein
MENTSEATAAKKDNNQLLIRTDHTKANAIFRTPARNAMMKVSKPS